NGNPPDQFRETTAIAAYSSVVTSKYAGISAFISIRKLGTAVSLSAKSSSDTVRKSIFPRYCSSSLTRSGYSSRHGSHHVAQKLINSGLPFGLRRRFRPSTSICVILGLAAGAEVAAVWAAT